MMEDMIVRSFQPELEVRTQGAKREIEGIAVPFNRPQRINSHLVEQFDPGAADHQFAAMHRIVAAYEHIQLGGHLVGKTVHMENTREGLLWRAKISKTRAGDDMLELVKDGVLTNLSVGFRDRGNRKIRATAGEYAGETILSRVKVDLFEVAVTLEGAYGELATIGGVRRIHPAGEEIAEDHGEDVPDLSEEYEAREALRAQAANLRRELDEFTKRAARFLD